MFALFSDQTFGGPHLSAAGCLLLKGSEGRQQALNPANRLVLLKLNLLSVAPKSHPHYSSISQYFAVLDKCPQKHYRIITFHLPTFSPGDEVASDIFRLLSSTR